MNRTLVTGGVLALVAAVVALLGEALSLTSPWPVLLAAAAGLAAAPAAGRGSAFVVGAVTVAACRELPASGCRRRRSPAARERAIQERPWAAGGP